MRLPLSSLSEPLRGRLIARGVSDGSFVEVERHVFTEEIHRTDANLSAPREVVGSVHPAWTDWVATKAVPVAEWPALIRWIARHEQPGEIGVGDTLERLLRNKGGAAFKSITARLGIDCGCGDSTSGRQGALNRRFPYTGLKPDCITNSESLQSGKNL